MRIDRTHASWAVASLAILGISLVIYGMFRVPAGTGSMGGTAAGLLFGSTGFAFMIFAALLGARKRVPVYRLGRAQTWMRGHLWLGLLSLPLILLHSGFRYGHGLSAWLMTLLIIVVVSGVVGAALQHYMPRVMTREVTMETIYEEIGHVRAQLLEEAEEMMQQAAGAENKKAAEGGEADSAATVAVADEPAPLRNFYQQEIEAVPRKARRTRQSPRRSRASAQRVRATANAGPGVAPYHDRRSGRNLRGGAAAYAAEPAAHMAARLAAAA